MEVLTKKCPDCGKEISSIYEAQLNNNYEIHIKNCKKKKPSNEAGDTNEISTTS